MHGAAHGSANSIDARPGVGGRPTIVFVQYLRGVAPVIVLWAHFSGLWLYAHHQSAPFYTAWYSNVARPLGLYQDAGHLGVVLFFFVSGYIVSFASSKERAFEFSVKRLFRLAPALWVAVGVVFLARAVDFRLTGGYPAGTDGSDLVSYVRGALLLDMVQGKPQINGVTWTLVVEVAFYLLTALVAGATRRTPGGATILMLGIWSVTAVVLHQHVATSRADYFSIYVGLLILGRALYLAHTGLVRGRAGFWLCLLIVVTWVTVYQVCMPGLLLSPDGPANSYVVGFLIFVSLMYGAPKRVPWFIRKLSDISYSLYLLHIPIGMVAIDVAVRSGVPLPWAIALGAVLAVIGASLSYRFVERPAQQVGRRFLAGRSSKGHGTGTDRGRGATISPPAAVPALAVSE